MELEQLGGSNIFVMASCSKVWGRTMARSGGTRSNERCMRLENNGGQLIPGILDHITVEHIATKVPWRTLLVLSAVSRGWLHAIRTREVHKARIGTQSPEELVLVNYLRPNNWICLYSMRDNVCVDLPPIPLPFGGFPFLCQCVAVDGKVYVLGGLTKGAPRDSAMYVLDLAGQRKWEPCAPMKDARIEFACGVLKGKIYVFGGSFLSKPVLGSEVYDPVTDQWSPIRPMNSMRCNQRVEALGEEVFVLGGEFSDRKNFGWRGGRPVALDFESRGTSKVLNFYGVFNPLKDEWRVLKRDSDEVLFTAEGRLYSMCRQGIHIIDADGNSRTQLQSHSFPIFGSLEVCPVAVQAVENELLAIVKVKKCYHLVRSSGFGDESCDVGWERARFSQTSAGFPGQLRGEIMSSIRL